LTDRYNVSSRYPTYFNGDTISGTVEIKLNSNSLKHKGIKAEIHGIVEKYGTLTTTNSFLFLTSELMSAGEVVQEKIKLNFNFRSPYLKYESYKGKHASVKYFIKIIIDSTLSNSSYEKEFAVVNPYDESILYENDFPLKMRVGVKNILSLSIEFKHCNYNCRGTLKGLVTFNLLKINIKSMEVQILRKEVVFGEKKHEPEYISRYELIDGGPIEHDKIPIRFFLKSYNLTPSYLDVEGIFEVKYFLNLTVVDDDNNMYYKSAEINLFRIFRNRRAHMQYFDNYGLFISEPFFKEDYCYQPNNINKENNNNYINYNDDNDYRYNNYKRDNFNEINKKRLENNGINNSGIINDIDNNNNYNKNEIDNINYNNRRFNIRKEFNNNRNNSQNNEDKNNYKYNYHYNNVDDNFNRFNTINTDNNFNRNFNNTNRNKFFKNINFNEERYLTKTNINNRNNHLLNINHKTKTLEQNNIHKNPFYKFHNNTSSRKLFGDD